MLGTEVFFVVRFFQFGCFFPVVSFLFLPLNVNSFHSWFLLKIYYAVCLAEQFYEVHQLQSAQRSLLLFALPELRSWLNALFVWPRKFMAYCCELKQFCCCFYRFLLNVRNILQFIEFIGVALRDSMVVRVVVISWLFFIGSLFFK